LKFKELADNSKDTVEGVKDKLQKANKLQSFFNYLINCKVIDFVMEMAAKVE
jgi:hypothetical protein